MMSPTMKALYTYLWNTGNALSNIRLLVEGAVTLYENDASCLCQLALSQQDQTAAIAFNTVSMKEAIRAGVWLSSWFFIGGKRLLGWRNAA